MAVQMMLGGFPFTLSTGEYDTQDTSLSWRWTKKDRLNRKPAMQFLGSDTIQKTLNGTIHIFEESDLKIPDQMTAEADGGEALMLIASSDTDKARYLGLWVIQKIEFNESDLNGDGKAQTIHFSVTIEEYGEDEIQM